ncbi:YebC/PmpR family DNA-binding transcriptional regulator [Halobacteriovorax sp. HLS]|uniref:YebC/PmpR family DNA-binding transcriptional regulator n=1 Tax=Halobacteriovorax sp. HLS TaxID=2234000 RepID=UPI000FDA6C76|nr:YebC/PmpR family DNA-binding transcriptional regulator [Halobacteriovorax sp. HLS]
MAGHSKWANIRHRKGAQDKKRGKIFTKLIKEITVAVKGSGPDPDANPRLRLALQNARGQNLPKDTIDRAIKKASGEGGEDYVESTFEGYGPDGSAVFIETATDNNTRTVSSVRAAFNKYNGSLGKDGCLQFIFDHKGVFLIEKEQIKMSEDDFMLEVIDGGAEDVDFDDEQYTVVTTAMEDFGSVSAKLAELEIEAQEAGLQRLPTTTKTLSAEDLVTFNKLIDVLEDNDDVQKVYHNIEIEDEEEN